MEIIEDNFHDASFIWRILSFLHRYFCIFVRLLMVKLYDERGQSMPPIDNQLLIESATSIAEKIRTKEVSAVKVMAAFIRRIKQINPLLNCVVDERFKDALADATAVDVLIASNKYTADELRESKPFLGVPFSITDSIGVDGMIQTCGLWLKRNDISFQDAEVVCLMREAGAIPFAVTNVPVLGRWWETANRIFGRTRNPYDMNRIVGGSSGGEACLQASAGSPFGIGLDFDGSIRGPAFFNGIFGHKPSPNITSIDGVWPEKIGAAESFALSIGPMCRFACDLKPMLQIMAGERTKELQLDKPVNLTDLKYFYQEDDGGANFSLPIDSDIRTALDEVVKHIQIKLNRKPQRVQLQKLAQSMELFMANTMDKDFRGFDSRLTEFDGCLDPYTELFNWCIGTSMNTLPAILFVIYERLVRIKYDTPEYHQRVLECNELRQEFDEMLGDDGVFIYPVYSTMAPYHNEPIARGLQCGYAAIFNVLGLPSTAIPLGTGTSERLPIGIQVVANRNQDRLCLAVASELERTFGGWAPPEIIT